MGEIENLISELEDLNNKYKELNPREDPRERTKEEWKIYQENLKESGRIMIDFYNEVFKKKYSELGGEEFENVNDSLDYYAFMASKYIENENSFGLSVLLLRKGSVESDPNELEKLISELKEKLE